MSRRTDRTKRIIDICGGTFGLIIFSPIAAMAAIAIHLEDGRPILFRQERVGKDGERFHIAKFRTMSAAPGPLISTNSDPRITRVGGLLRRTKIDELPQFLNVIQGSMSLVGPRPEVATYVEAWSQSDRDIILSVRPGITDPASIVLRNESARLSTAEDPEAYYRTVLIPEKCAMYVDYVRTRTFAGDLRIIAQTLHAVIGK